MSLRRWPLKIKLLTGALLCLFLVVVTILLIDSDSHQAPLTIVLLSQTNESDGIKWCLFEIKNQSGHPVRFHTSRVETFTQGQWNVFYQKNEWAGLNGWNVSPGRHIQSIPRPPGLPNHQPWRLHLSCAKEPSSIQKRVNGLLRTVDLFAIKPLPDITCSVAD
jgi:hypothetical protein